MIGDKQRLVVGLGTAKAKAMNGLRTEVDFAANEAMVPNRVDEETAGEQADSAIVIGGADKYDLGVSASRQAIWRPREACGCGFLPFLGFDVMGGDEPVRTAAQMGAAGVVKAIPDLGLPPVVEGLDLVLEAMLARWGEDGGDAQGQAEEGDRTETIRMVMGAVEAEVVVELSVGGQAMGAPVGPQRVLRELGGGGGGRRRRRVPPTKPCRLRTWAMVGRLGRDWPGGDWARRARRMATGPYSPKASRWRSRCRRARMRSTILRDRAEGVQRGRRDWS